MSQKNEEMDALKAELLDAGQGHIFEQIPDLAPGHPIVEQLLGLEIRDSLDHYDCAKSRDLEIAEESADPLDAKNVLVWNNCARELRDNICEIGWESIRTGSVAAVIMSGGQGTRLGFDGPKGMYNMQLPSGKTIFHIHIERINRIRTLAARNSISGIMSSLPSIPIYIMTSEINTKIIENYFRDANYFGYPQEDIFFFEQSLEPCLSFDGKIVIESEESLSLAPDGNGGIYNALRKSGAIDDMQNRNIEHLHIYGIDNVLTKSLDPAFIGCCINSESEIGNKVVLRASKNEKVGVAAEKNGKMVILEYIEIPKALAETSDENGKLIYSAGNICNHYLNLSFLVKVILPNLMKTYHLARKKLKYMDPSSREVIQPSMNNGYKLEMYIFDVFPLASKWIVMEVNRKDEFAPVKNEPGNDSDSPDTAKKLLSEQAIRWLEAAGAKIEDKSNTLDKLIEISPTLSYEGEGLDGYKDQIIIPPCYLE